jgi:hypothetical protein
MSFQKYWHENGIEYVSEESYEAEYTDSPIFQRKHKSLVIMAHVKHHHSLKYQLIMIPW